MLAKPLIRSSDSTVGNNAIAYIDSKIKHKTSGKGFKNHFMNLLNGNLVSSSLEDVGSNRNSTDASQLNESKNSGTIE